MDLVAPRMTSKNPHFCSGCLWVNSCLPGQCGPILLSSEPLPGLLLICIAWASDLLRIWQLFLWQCYTDYNPSILIIYENKHVCMVWQCTAVTEPSGSLPLVCDQSWMQSEFKANLDYKMRFHIKKTTTKLNILFFTATVWAGLRGYDSNGGLVWVDSLCFSSGTGSYLGQVSHSSRKSRGELLMILKFSAQNQPCQVHPNPTGQSK